MRGIYQGMTNLLLMPIYDLQMLAHVILLNTLGRYSIEWASMTRCGIRIFTKRFVSIFLKT